MPPVIEHVTVCPVVEQLAPPVVVPQAGKAVAGKPWSARLSETEAAVLAVPPVFVTTME
jgi:hypothetical protein